MQLDQQTREDGATKIMIIYKLSRNVSYIPGELAMKQATASASVSSRNSSHGNWNKRLVKKSFRPFQNYKSKNYKILLPGRLASESSSHITETLHIWNYGFNYVEHTQVLALRTNHTYGSQLWGGGISITSLQTLTYFAPKNGPLANF